MTAFYTAKRKDYNMGISKEIWQAERFALMEEIFDKGDYCKNCAQKVVTKDPYSTGDINYEIRECDSNSPDDCEGVIEEWYDGCMKLDTL
mgnify:CR=1 FL=1